MAIEPSELKSVPLFTGIGDDALAKLLALLEEERVEEGAVLFEAGKRPTRLILLIEGSLSVRDADGEVFLVRPIAPVGELGAVTGELRNLTTVAAEPSLLLTTPVPTLHDYFRQHGDVAVAFQNNMLKLAARKIGRDRRRLREMRENIVSSQKAMKRMREALLDSEDNPLHATLYEQLDALIEQNRKVHYLVEPSRLVPTHVRFDDGEERRVTAVSNEWLYFDNPPPGRDVNSEWSGVLVLDGSELPVSGTVEKWNSGEAAIFLDEMIDAYDRQLSDHLTRAQLLDIVL